MLAARAAARRHQRQTSRALASSFAQLHLPWLAQAQLRWSTSQQLIASPDAARKPQSARIRTTRLQVRSLATAVISHSPRHDSSALAVSLNGTNSTPSEDDHVPFDIATFANRPGPLASGLPRPNEPVVLNPPLRNPKDVIQVKSLTGTFKEIINHLHTCLRVGRRDRAEAIVQRVAEQRGQQSFEARHAHSVYMQGMLTSLMLHGRDSPQSAVLLKEMQKWFEVEVRGKGVVLDASILVPLMRATIRGLEGSQRERSIRRYADMSRELGEEVMDDVLLSEEYDDNEFAILGHATQYLYEDEHTPDGAAAETPTTSEHGVQAEITPEDKPADRVVVPEVLATEQRGEGLSSVKQTLSVLEDLAPLPPDATPEARRQHTLLREQRLEDAAVDVAIDRWKRADDDLRKIGIHTSMQSKPISALMWQWYSNLLPAIEKELEEVQKTTGQDSDRLAYGPYLELLPARQVAANTIIHLLSSVAGAKNRKTGTHEAEAKLNGLTVNLARALEADCLASVASGSRKQAKPKFNKAQLRKQAVRALEKDIEKAKPESKVRARKASQAELAQVEWPINVCVKLGAMLISKLVETAQLPVTREHPRTKEQITQLQPAFLHRVKYVAGKRSGLIVPNPALLDKLQSEPVGSVIAKRMPMIVEPKPWVGWTDGGYLHYRNTAVRLSKGETAIAKEYFLAAHDRNDLDTLYKGMTALGKVPWKVHPDVFKVQLEAWNSGEPIASFAPVSTDIAMPTEPPSTADVSDRKKWLAEVQGIANKRSGNHSKRCFQNFQLELARTMVNETMYFPHNLDFRGRAYPIPPYLNHMGADNVRGLLVFAEGKELGETGLRWLKIHMATVAGHDKASMEERIEFTMNHLDEIYDSARNPLNGKRWWLQAEDAWQTLAACFELVAALESPDPTKFVSHLPIQQDGTCNGLQHYAALGGDRVGAAQVNLEPSDRPADVYTAVLVAVQAEIEKDAKNGDPIAQKLHGRITRKCVKQPVMTNVYGVTFYGARAQVRKQLEVLFPEVNRFDTVNHGNMAQYVAQKIFKSLGQMFSGAQAIQAWLGECADRISTALTPEQIKELRKEAAENAKKAIKMSDSEPLFKSTVVWTTPLRLPVVQPYRVSKSKVFATSMQHVAIQNPQAWDPVSRRKQLQAFPPNFIHSLDATHMLLSAIKCNENGMTFASIHDSFWTHACDVNNMSEVLRDAFVAMHSEDIVGRLREEFETRYKGYMYLATVDSTTPTGRQILKRRAELRSEARRRLKNQGINPTSELALEAERMQLLNSKSPEQRKKGEAMITPGSILQQAGITSASAPSLELAVQRLGEIPTHTKKVEVGIAEEAHEDARDAVPEDLDGITHEAADGDPVADVDGAADKTVTRPPKDDEIPKLANNKKSKFAKKLHVWLPLTFPEVPAKGDFDVRRLRESRYFFH